MKRPLLLLVILIVISASYFFLGFYNVSATIPHMKITETFFHIIAERSIKRNSASINNTYDINDQGMYIKGFSEYEEMCVQCHGWDTIEASNTGKGLNPKPPHFPDEGLYEFTVEELFWVTKNGIKMTGMPAYGPTHDDKTVWAIAIFLDRSRDLNTEDYNKLKIEDSDIDNEYHHGD